MTINSASADALHHAGAFLLVRVEPAFEKQIGHAENAVHGRADFVAHVGEKLALGLVGVFGRFFRNLQFLFCSAAVRDLAKAPHPAHCLAGYGLRLGVPLKHDAHHGIRARRRFALRLH